jgi:t-SNARE complex subunit (syntaxin)
MKDRLNEFKGIAMKNGTFTISMKDLEDGLPENGRGNHMSASESTEFLRQEHWDDVENFLAQVNDLKQKIEQLERLHSEMREIHGKILVTPTADPQDAKQLAAVVDSFTSLSKVVNTLSKKLNQDAQTFEKESSNTGGAEARIRSNQVLVLNRAIRTVLTDFNNEQIRYKEKCKARMHQCLKIADNEMTDDEIDSAIEKGQFYSTKSILMGDRDKKLLYEDVKNRHEDILKLEKSIAELHEMFQDVAMLVESQGEMLNVIENNVNNATEYARKAHTNVTQAREAKQRNMKLKVAICIGCSLLIFFLLIFGAGAFCFYLPFICR